MSRGFVLGLLAVAAVVAGFLVLSGDDDRYRVTVVLKDAGGLRKGANVRVAGAPSGRVTGLHLDSQDRAVAELRLEPGVAPIGAGARALVDTDGFFGERFVQIDRGDLSHPQPDGSTIPEAHSSVSVRLDDVVDALDMDTQQALKVFLNEQGAAVVGRGTDLANVLAALPPSLQQTGALLRELGADNRALGRLIESSDRVVGSVAHEHTNFGRLFGAFSATLDALDSRRADLGETFRRAPATLRSARAALTSLESAAAPLIPAARGLRSTAPALTSTLAALPDFARDGIPALDTLSRVSPTLGRLGTRATPVVRELRPMARSLSNYTRRGFGPFTDILDKAGPDLLGTMEGWARSTQGRDASSHIFRFGATSGSDSLALLLGPPKKHRKHKHTPRLPHVHAPRPPQLPVRPRPVLNTVLDTAKDVLHKPAPVHVAVPRADDLLDFLLKP